MKLFARILSVRNARPMSRDKADTLLLLLACVLVLAPHTAHLPSWVIGAVIALLLWRSWITLRGNRMPPRWLLLPLAVLAIAGIYLTFKTIIGQDAGVAMLVLLLAFKLLEMHAKRDLFVVVFLGFFLLLANFLYTQSIATAALTIAALVVMLTAQLSFQYTGAVPPFSKRLRSGATIAALAVPLTIMLFVLFPRIQGPLWGMPGNDRSGRSGLSDHLSPGDIASLLLSNEIAFRVKFLNAVPPNPKLYWRALVLDQFDGRTWRQSVTLRDSHVPEPLVVHGTAVHYQITQEAGSQARLFALDMPQAAPQLNNNRVRLTPGMQLVTRHAIDARVRYDVVSYPDYSLQSNASPADLQNWLMLPADYNPRTLQFARNLHKRIPGDAERIETVLTFFSDKSFKFIYTLKPPPLGQNSIDEFLFVTRAGFCEHYASAFVVLMRAMGIPARIVAGYQGGELNPIDGFMTVRQSDAHAWAEVWLPQRGWIRIDPTAAVAPDRIERANRADISPAPTLGGLFNLDTAHHFWLAALRFRWDAINNGWNQWVLNYTPERQKSLLGAMGFDNIDWRGMILLMLVVGGLIMLAIAIPLLSQRSKTDPVEIMYARLCKRMGQLGLARHPYEAPRSYAARLLREKSSLIPKQKHALEHFLMLCETVRYSPMNSVARARMLLKLEILLKQCR